MHTKAVDLRERVNYKIESEEIENEDETGIMIKKKTKQKNLTNMLKYLVVLPFALVRSAISPSTDAVSLALAGQPVSFEPIAIGPHIEANAGDALNGLVDDVIRLIFKHGKVIYRTLYWNIFAL